MYVFYVYYKSGGSDGKEDCNDREKKLHTFLEGVCAIKIGCAVNAGTGSNIYILFGSITTVWSKGKEQEKKKLCNHSI